MFFKITRAAFPAFQEKLKSLHPYELPEVIALPLAAGLPDYLNWVRENCSPPPTK